MRHLPKTFAPFPAKTQFQNLTGERFGRLTVIGYAGGRNNNSYWWCRCDCGQITSPAAIKLRRGSTESCGCLKREITAARSKTHGESRRTPEYQTYQSMRQRTLNSSVKNWRDYGGRGIKVCDRWRDGEDTKTGFECFLLDMGRRPSPEHSIDRYPDNDGNYEPGNCRWATRLEQSRNRRWSRPEVLFFDLATRTGWACGSKSGVWEYGLFDIPKTHENIGRYLNIAHDKIHDLVARLRPHKIAFESPFLNRRIDTIIKIRKLAGLANVVEQVSDRHGLPCEEASISDICRHFLGPHYPRRHQEKKSATKAKCCDLGIEVSDDNIADAIAGFSYMMAVAHPTSMIGVMPLFRREIGDD